MATLRLFLASSLLVVVASCGEQVVGFEDRATPLATLRVETPGFGGTASHVALVWGGPWLPEAFCLLPPEHAEAAAVIEAGCPDMFGFVPRRVGRVAPILDGAATLEMFTLPEPDVMVGDVTARIAYGSVVVFDDRNGNGTLDLRRGNFNPGDGPPGERDVIRGASFVAMTEPDQRVVFREGAYNGATAFYPRAGCPEPPRGFSIAGAGGFSASEALAAALQGKLPEQDPASCTTASMETGVVTVAPRDPGGLAELACIRRVGSGFARYRRPPDTISTFGKKLACVGLPDLGVITGESDPGAAGITQLVITGPDTDPCPTVWHYTLRGCDSDATCANPEWDLTASPPSWWPCE